MAEYLIQGETLINMADKIRVLNGVEGAMTPVQMDGNLGEVNDEVGSQAELIAQIASALEGKAGGSGPETCTLEIRQYPSPNTNYINFPFKCYYTQLVDGKLQTSSVSLNGSVTIENVPVLHPLYFMASANNCIIYSCTMSGTNCTSQRIQDIGGIGFVKVVPGEALAGTVGLISGYCYGVSKS